MFVLASKLPELRRKFDALRRVAARLGVAAPNLVEVGAKHVRPVPVTRRDEDGRIRHGEELRNVVECRVDGDWPRFKGWTFRAKVEIIEADDRTLAAMVHGQAPERVHALVDTPCEHCGTNRRRNAVFGVEHADGTYKVVGRSCLAAFCGTSTPEDLAALACRILDVTSELDGCEFGGIVLEPRLDMQDVLARAAAYMRLDGRYISSRVSEDIGQPSTSTKARDIRRAVDVTDVDRERVTAAVAWARELPEDCADDFLRTCGLVSRCLRALPERFSGHAIAILPAHERYMRNQLDVSDAAASIYQGEVGKRMRKLRLTVLRVVSYETMYGTTYINVMRDSAGNRFTWKGSSGLELGDVVLDGTVKKHEIYTTEPRDGSAPLSTQTTYITRCKKVAT